MPSLNWPDLVRLANSVGLRTLSVTDTEPMSHAAKSLAIWQNQGWAADMGYMHRPAEKLANPAVLLPEAKSVIAFALHYQAGPVPPRPKGHGRVARYAWGLDYHAVLSDRLKRLVQVVEAELGQKIQARVFSDSVPLMERPLAERAGLGFIGKNTLLIRPREGSLFFLAEILWNLEILNSPPPIPAQGKCGSCSKCQSACPTDAFIAEYSLDARRCISYLSIEKRGALSIWERESLGEWLFGCDICQEACPFNYTAIKNGNSLSDNCFSLENGPGPWLSIHELLTINSEAQFKSLFTGRALLRAKRSGLLRNAVIVAANTSAIELLPAIIDRADNDYDPIVRQHALWSAVKLAIQSGNGDKLKLQEKTEHGLSDPDMQVRAEANQLLTDYF